MIEKRCHRLKKKNTKKSFIKLAIQIISLIIVLLVASYVVNFIVNKTIANSTSVDPSIQTQYDAPKEILNFSQSKEVKDEKKVDFSATPEKLKPDSQMKISLPKKLDNEEHKEDRTFHVVIISCLMITVGILVVVGMYFQITGGVMPKFKKKDNTKNTL